MNIALIFKLIYKILQTIRFEHWAS